MARGAVTLCIGIKGNTTQLARRTLRGTVRGFLRRGDGPTRKGRAVQRLVGRGTNISGVRVASDGVGTFRDATGGCGVSFSLGGIGNRRAHCLIFFGNQSTSIVATTFRRFSTGGLGQRGGPSVHGTLTTTGSGTGRLGTTHSGMGGVSEKHRV